jgi:hypothetical protein
MEQTDRNDRPITLKDLIEAEARIEDRIVKGVVAAIEKRLDVWPSLRNAPIDDEPETEQERAAVERARQSPRELDTDHGYLRRELGLSRLPACSTFTSC